MKIEELRELANKGRDGLINFSGDTASKGYYQGKLMATMSNLSPHIVRFLLSYSESRKNLGKIDRAVNDVVLNLNWKNLEEAIEQEKA